MVIDSGTLKEKPGDYELMVVLSPEVADDSLETAINNISNFITSRGGTIFQQDRWGKRALAYPIKHFAQGTYVLTRFNLKPASCKELENSIRINEQVLRHLLIKLQGEMPKKAVAPIAPVAQAEPAAPVTPVEPVAPAA